MKHQTNIQNTESPAWLRGPEGVATYAGVSIRTAQGWLSDGLEAERVTSRLVLVDPGAVDSYIRLKGAQRRAGTKHQSGDVVAL